MRRRVQSFDRAVVGCVVQIRLDDDLLSSFVSSVAATMSAVEVVKNGVPCLGVAFLICQLGLWTCLEAFPSAGQADPRKWRNW